MTKKDEKLVAKESEVDSIKITLLKSHSEVLFLYTVCFRMLNSSNYSRKKTRKLRLKNVK